MTNNSNNTITSVMTDDDNISLMRTRLINELRGPLLNYNIDMVTLTGMQTKELMSCKKILEAIKEMETNIKHKKAEYNKSLINMSKVAKTSGLDRKTIERNPIFRTIVEAHLSKEIKQKEITKISMELEKYKNSEREHELQLQACLDVKLENVKLKKDLKSKESECDLLQESLKEKINQIRELQAQIKSQGRITLTLPSTSS